MEIGSKRRDQLLNNSHIHTSIYRYEEFYLLRYNAVQSVERLKGNPRFGLKVIVSHSRNWNKADPFHVGFLLA
jgi:hypothetical protein